MKKERLILNKRIFLIKPFLYIVFLVSFASTAQNLVPNGSFEEYSECPLERELNNGQFERCVGWWYPTNYSIGTPDYFNECNNAINGFVGVPNNDMGVQYPFDGTGMIGLGAISVYTPDQSYDGFEPISCRLFSTLKPCYQYHFSCYVSLAEISTYGVDELSFICSTDSLVLNNFEDVFEVKPNWSNNMVIVDTTNWVKLDGTFIAKGDERFLTIGYFKTKDETNWVQNNTAGNVNYDMAYYYLDSVSLIEIGEVQNCTPNIPNVFTPNDDLLNDNYSILGLNITEMVILSRWGNRITILNEDQPTWDGTFEGESCSEGSYFYRAKFGEIYLTGFITLIR